jgi:hypothetical protein
MQHQSTPIKHLIISKCGVVLSSEKDSDNSAHHNRIDRVTNMIYVIGRLFKTGIDNNQEENYEV